MNMFYELNIPYAACEQLGIVSYYLSNKELFCSDSNEGAYTNVGVISYEKGSEIISKYYGRHQQCMMFVFKQNNRKRWIHSFIRTTNQNASC